MSPLPAAVTLAAAALLAAAGPSAAAGAQPGAGRPLGRHLAAPAAADRLRFPFQDPSAASALYDFGLDPWAASGEVHTGIDVVAAHSGSQPEMLEVAIVAPATGEVVWVLPGESGAGLASVLVLIRMNDYWLVALNLEPQSAAPATNAEQLKRVYVTPGQKVRAGDVVADLVVWNVAPGSYPHVHLDLLYKSPTQTLEELRDHFLEIAISDGTTLPPRAGRGSPWRPRNLGIPSTAFCPYEYSTPQARAIYISLPAYAANGDPCACPCAYGSTGGDCGVCEGLRSYPADLSEVETDVS